MKLLVDMNLSPRWVTVLKAAGWEAVHWSGVGAADAKDTEIMAYARTHDYVVLTQDLDFGAILAATQGEKPSVVQLRTDAGTPELIGPRVLVALRALEATLEDGAFATVDVHRARVRLLPLR